MNPQGSAVLRFDHVTKSMGTARILQDVSFDIPRGSALSILGRRGAGKTITLKLAIGLLRPDRGAILIDGEDITALADEDLLRVRRSMGFVFQNAAPFDSMSVAENVAFVLQYNSRRPQSETQERVHHLLEQLGLEGDAHTMPAHLSVGMRKLLGLARALARDPALLLLDDPFSGVDAATAGLIRTLLLDLKRHRHTTLLIAANSMAEVRHLGDQLAILDAGRLSTCGPAAELGRCGNSVASPSGLQEDS